MKCNKDNNGVFREKNYLHCLSQNKVKIDNDKKPQYTEKTVILQKNFKQHDQIVASILPAEPKNLFKENLGKITGKDSNFHYCHFKWMSRVKVLFFLNNYVK